MKTEDLASTKSRAFKSRPDFGSDRPARVQLKGADLKLLLEKKNPLVVEIGCGVGLHPILYSELYPSKSIIAIERTTDKFAKFAGRLGRHEHLHDRLCAVHADAIHFLDQNFANASIDEVWILYPNPEIAKPSRRWFRTPFMGRLIQLMRPGASLYFATNIEDYASSSTAIAVQLGFLQVVGEKILKTTHPEFAPRSHFEKKYFERGESLFNFEFKLEPKFEKKLERAGV